MRCASHSNDTSNPASVFPWLVAIFIKNGTNNQFDYYCDGTLLSDKAVLTAARCLQRGNETVNADDVITFLGKRSLQNTAQGEVILRVQQLTIHPNFSLQNQAADLAVLQLEEPVVFTDLIQPACLVDDGETDEAVATAWGETLSLIKFAEKNHTCVGEPVDNTFCATYGASVALCPSYGGVYAALESGRWCAAGVRTGDVTKRGLCFDKTVAFTDLRAYTQWLRDFSQ
ncbi:trypsin domain-containing protein [Phthorimaea operculella]|nr:trypsin domain-containing protein [Phthorimaea operculella]